MNNKLWIFGCSVSDKNQPINLKGYFKFKGGLIKTWSEILAEMLGYELKNYGISGGSNLAIMELFSNKCSEINDGDIVILNWTEIERFRIASDKWLNVLIYHLFNDELKNEIKVFEKNLVSKTTISEILLNRQNNLYFLELDSWSRFINEFCERSKVKIFFWGLTSYRDYMIKINGVDLHEHITKNFGRIMEETNNQIIDGHFSEIAHKECANIFYKLIKNK